MEFGAKLSVSLTGEGIADVDEIRLHLAALAESAGLDGLLAPRSCRHS